MKQKYSLGQIDGKQKDFKEDSAEKLGKNRIETQCYLFRNIYNLIFFAVQMLILSNFRPLPTYVC